MAQFDFPNMRKLVTEWADRRNLDTQLIETTDGLGWKILDQQTDQHIMTLLRRADDMSWQLTVEPVFSGSFGQNYKHLQQPMHSLALHLIDWSKGGSYIILFQAMTLLVKSYREVVSLYEDINHLLKEETL